MGRVPCCDKNGLKKGPWTPEEDLKLTNYIQFHGPGNWRSLPINAGICYNFLFPTLPQCFDIGKIYLMCVTLFLIDQNYHFCFKKM